MRSPDRVTSLVEAQAHSCIGEGDEQGSLGGDVEHEGSDRVEDVAAFDGLGNSVGEPGLRVLDVVQKMPSEGENAEVVGTYDVEVAGYVPEERAATAFDKFHVESPFKKPDDINVEVREQDGNVLLHVAFETSGDDLTRIERQGSDVTRYVIRAAR